MIINCTKKLQDELKIKPNLVEITDPLFSWHANIININRRKTLILVNDANRYVIVLHGLKAKDFKNVDTLILDAIKETMLVDCIKPEIAEKYIIDGGQVVFSKTQNKALVARMNKGCVAADVFDTEYNTDTISQPGVTKKANSYIFIEIDKNYFHPNELFYADLEKLYGSPIFSTKALVLKVKLDLEKFDIWRRVIVPLNYNFEELHEVIRIIFDWGYHHLHDFMIFEKGKPIANIISDEEDIEFFPEYPLLLESQTKIADFMPKYKQIIYTYDFGDNWQHIIEIENLLFDYDKNYPIYQGGVGDRPPEDVGGEGGYEEFVEIMNNPSHEDYQHMKMWSENQYYKGFDIDIVNRQLRHL